MTGNFRQRRPAATAALSLALATATASGAGSQSPDGDLDAAFERFWNASRDARVMAAIDDILAFEPDFEEALRRVRAGRPYSADVDTGLLLRTRRHPFHYSILIPEDYDPAHRYPVVFLLHGGVSRPQWERDGSWWRNYDRSKNRQRIAVYPASWDRAKWWQGSQVENLEAILESLKRRYNVDENRVAMIGISDGGTGAYFFAFRAPTPWASFLPLIGHAAVLANQRLGVDGQMYAANLVNRPMLVVNGGQDRLYPSSRVRPYIELFRRAGADVEFIDKPEAGHGLAWWPEEEQRILDFIADRVRDPLPERVGWETERTDRYNRCSWLMITGLGAEAGDADFEDFNQLGRVLPRPVFPRDKPSGRVEIERRGNTVDAKTRGVTRFRLLLSPDEFDLSRPVTVSVNGREVFSGTVESDIGTLLLWAAEDQDRTMLFAAELDIEIP